MLGFRLCFDDHVPKQVECRTQVLENIIIFTEKDAHLAPDNLHDPCTRNGLECRNEDQPMGVTCRNYQVRFFCAGEDKKEVVTDNSSMIALAAGLTFLFPIVVALAINICKNNCCKRGNDQPRQVDRSVSTETTFGQQSLFDLPPSYSCLFGNNSTALSTEFLVSPSSTNINDSDQSESQSHHPTLSSMPSSNSIAMCSLADIESRYQQFRERLKQQPGMHLSVLELLNNPTTAGSTTPPPSYNDALIILAALTQKPEEQPETAQHVT